MDYLIIGFLFLALAHFVYGSILAPSFRIIDELRLVKIKICDSSSKRHFCDNPPDPL